MLVFRAFSDLRSYPSQDLQKALPEIADVLKQSPLVSPRELQGFLELLAELGGGERLDAEARYVDLFDRGPALSLHLFEHLHGDSRDRGTAMVELKQLYARAGFTLTRSELPDYLLVVLEYLGCRDIAEARALPSDCAHILTTIGQSLIARRSCYAAVLQTLLERQAAAEPVANLDVEFDSHAGDLGIGRCRHSPYLVAEFGKLFTTGKPVIFAFHGYQALIHRLT
jgi:nitrate reductase delta subunit